MAPRWLALGLAFPLFLAAAASAQGDEDYEEGEARTGYYAGASFAVGINTFERDVQRKMSFDFSTSEVIGFDARFGYRLHPRYAAELEVQWLNPFDLNSDTAGNIRVEPVVVTANGRIFLARGIWQPYFTLGTGFMHIDLRDKGVGISDSRDAGWVMRFGAGLEHYITDEFVLTTGASYVLPLAGRAEDFDFVSIEVLGFTWRF